MFNTRWLLLSALCSLSTFASSSLEQKTLRVESLMRLQPELSAVSFDGYQRELGYERLGLAVEARAQIETNLLAEKIKAQIHLAYEAALKENKSPEDARLEIRDAIESDLELAAPSMKDELLEYALIVLDSVDDPAVNEEVKLPSIFKTMESVVLSRKSFLDPRDAFVFSPTANSSKDSEKKIYSSREQLLSSLVSERESSRWVSSTNLTTRTAEIVKTESSLSMQVKMEFLGAEIEAGPRITFSRQIATEAIVTSEGLNPVITSSGEFDRYKKGTNNQYITKNGKKVPRYISFYCDAELKFETDTVGSGGFKYFGMGADLKVSKSFQNSVTIQSRRIALPEVVGNKTVTVNMIAQVCNSFINQKYSNSMTVRKSLDAMMKGVVSGLVYSNPRTTCATDSACTNWFNKENIAFKRRGNRARCVENSKEKFKSCQLRGLAGQNCAVIENRKKTSSGENEYICDTGLRCVKYIDATYVLGYNWSYSVGRCQK